VAVSLSFWRAFPLVSSIVFMLLIERFLYTEMLAKIG
jgi:hypothetical protein